MMELIIIFILISILIPTAYASVIGAPILPSIGHHIQTSLEKAGVKEGVRFYELGTGTGSVSAIALKMGARVTGYELSPIFYLISFIRLKLTKKSFKLYLKNFIKSDISEADIIYIFLIPRTISNIKDTLFSKVRPGTKIISYAFPILGWQINDKIELINKPTIYIYIKK